MNENELNNVDEAKRKSNINMDYIIGLSIGSFCTGLMGFFIFGLIFGIVAIVLGSIAISKCKLEKENEDKKSTILGMKILSVLGIITGVADVLFVVVGLVMVFTVMGKALQF